MEPTMGVRHISAFSQYRCCPKLLAPRAPFESQKPTRETFSRRCPKLGNKNGRDVGRKKLAFFTKILTRFKWDAGQKTEIILGNTGIIIFFGDCSYSVDGGVKGGNRENQW